MHCSGTILQLMYGSGILFNNMYCAATLLSYAGTDVKNMFYVGTLFNMVCVLVTYVFDL